MVVGLEGDEDEGWVDRLFNKWAFNIEETDEKEGEDEVFNEYSIPLKNIPQLKDSSSSSSSSDVNHDDNADSDSTVVKICWNWRFQENQSHNISPLPPHLMVVGGDTNETNNSIEEEEDDRREHSHWFSFSTGHINP